MAVREQTQERVRAHKRTGIDRAEPARVDPDRVDPDGIEPGKVGPGSVKPDSAGPDSAAPDSAEPFDEQQFFGLQPTPSAALPPPEPLLENLTRCVIEVLAGARELEQLMRWVTDDVYRHLLKRVVLAARARTVKNQPASRPQFAIGTTTTYQPTDGVVEAVVMVHSRARSRAVALRLEGLDSRWRATAIHVL